MASTTTDDECHAEYVHRQFIDQVVPAVVKVVWAIVGDRQQRGADRQHNEATEEQQVEKSAERLAMNTFLRQRIIMSRRIHTASHAQIRPADLSAKAARGPRLATRARRYSPRS